MSTSVTDGGISLNCSFALTLHGRKSLAKENFCASLLILSETSEDCLLHNISIESALEEPAEQGYGVSMELQANFAAVRYEASNSCISW